MAFKVDALTTQNKMLEAQITQQPTSSSTLLDKFPSKNELSHGEQCNAMILRGSKQIEGPKGVDNDVKLCDDENVIKKEVSSPSNDVHDDVVKDTNEIPKDLKHTSAKPYSPPLPFPQRMAKGKLDV